MQLAHMLGSPHLASVLTQFSLLASLSLALFSVTLLYFSFGVLSSFNVKLHQILYLDFIFASCIFPLRHMLSIFNPQSWVNITFQNSQDFCGYGQAFYHGPDGRYSELSGGSSVVSVAVAIMQLFEFTYSVMCLLQMDTASVFVFPLQQL